MRSGRAGRIEAGRDGGDRIGAGLAGGECHVFLLSGTLALVGVEGAVYEEYEGNE